MLHKKIAVVSIAHHGAKPRRLICGQPVTAMIATCVLPDKHESHFRLLT